MKVTDEALDQAAAKVAGEGNNATPLDRAANDVVASQRTAVRSTMYTALLEDPDVAARAQKLGRQTGIPSGVVQRNMAEVERNARLTDMDKLLEQHPAIVQFLSRPEFAAVAHDDIENLGAFDTTMRSLRKAGGATMSGLWSMASGLTGMARAGVEIAAPAADPLTGTLLPENPLRRTAEGLRGAQEFFAGQAEANMPKATGTISAGVYSGLASLSRNLAALPVAIVNPPAGLTIMAGSVAGEEYGKAREQNIDPLMAASYGVSQGAIEYATEKLPLFKLLGDLKAGAPLGRVFVNQMGTEVPGEQIATILQDLNEWAVLDKNQGKTLADYIDERPDAAVQTLIATVVGVGGQVSVVKGVEALVAALGPQIEQPGEGGAAGGGVRTVFEVSAKMQARMAQAELADREAQTLQQITAIVQQGKLAQRDPVAFQEFAQTVAENSPVQDVFVNAQTFAQLATEAGIQEAQLPENLRAQLPEALAIGGDLRIPIAEFAAQIAPTQYAQGLIDHLKTDPAGMSRAEAQVFMQSQAEEMQQEVERALAGQDEAALFRDSTETVRQGFEAQLNQVARFTEDVNRAYSTLLANFYAVTAANVGMTPEQLAQMYPLRVQAESVTGAQQFDQSPDLGQGGRPEVKAFPAMARAISQVREALNSHEKLYVRWSPTAKRDLLPTSNSRDFVAGRTHNGLSAVEITREDTDVDIAKAIAEYGFVRMQDGNSIPRIYIADRIGTDSDGHALIRPSSVALKLSRKVVADIDRGAHHAFELGADIADIKRRLNKDTVDAIGREILKKDLAKKLVEFEKYPPSPNQSPRREGAEPPILQTDTKAFREWFGDSKVVDDQGRPLVVYHGTAGDFSIFSEDFVGQEFGADKEGFFFADNARHTVVDGHIHEHSFGAGGYAKRASMSFGESTGTANIMPVYLSLQDPLTTEDLIYSLSLDESDPFDGDHPQNFLDDNKGEIIKLAKDEGKDGIALTSGNNSIYVAFRPAQIKSAIGNRGTFDPNTPNILYQSDKDLVVSTPSPNQSPRREGAEPPILQTDTKAFREWFGDSKVVDENGDPLVVYHGTIADFDSFDNRRTGANDNGLWGRGHYFSAHQDNANSYALRQGDGAHVIPAYISLKNPLILKTGSDLITRLPDGTDSHELIGPNLDGSKIKEIAVSSGHDGVIQIKPNGLIGDLVAFHPEQIKSAIGNRGTFDPNTPNILYQSDKDLVVSTPSPNQSPRREGAEFFQGGTGSRGQIAFGNDITKDPSTITLFKGADLSTFLHESGHFFLEALMDLAARVMANPAVFDNPEGQEQIVKDTQALLDWFGVNSVQEWFSLTADEKRAHHEKFAKGFEKYLFEGKAPSLELQSLFQRFRAWLLRVYRDLKAMRVELTDEVRGVMDRMLATTEQIDLAEKGRSMMPLFTSAETAGMTPQEFAAYQNIGQEATQEATQELQARTLRDMQWMRNARGREIKKLQKLMASRRREVRIEARARVMADPVYQAWAFLTNKMGEEAKAATAPTEVPKSKPGELDPTVDSLFTAIAKLGGLDRLEVEATWGWDPRERSPMPVFGAYTLRRQDGVSIDTMAERLATHGYLPLDKHGKPDVRDLENLFEEEYRGNPQYSTAYDYQAAVPTQPGESFDFERVGAGRLDIGTLLEAGTPREVVAVLEKYRMTAKNGIHPDFVAEQFGFTSADEMIRRLVSAEPLQDAVEGATDLFMLEKYGELASVEDIERAADAAIHNDARARFVSTELNALQRATGKPRVLAKAAKAFAETMVQRLKVRNVRPGQYAAAEGRASKASEKALRAGDTATAAAEKRNQLVNTYATRAAHDAITEVEQGLRYLKKFGSQGTRKNVDADYLDQIDTLLERFDLRSGQSLKSIDKRKSLASWISEQEDLGIEVDLPDKLRAEAFRQSYKDLTVEEFRGLIDSVKQIEHLGRLKERLLTAADNRRFAEVVKAITDAVVASAGGRVVNNRSRDTLGNRTANLFKGFVAAHRKVASLARELDGFTDGGPMWTYFIRTMNEAGDKEAGMRVQATKDVAEMLKPILSGQRLGGKGTYFESLGMSLNRGEQLILALNVGNAGNLQRLLDGRGWTLEQIQPVLAELSLSDWAFVQQIWDYFETYRPQIAAKERRVMGKEPNWVEPQPFTATLKDGTEVRLRGGYFPIVYDTRESGRAEQQADAEQAKQMMKGAFVAATTRRSFTKTRAEAVTGRPLSLTWDALFRGLNDVIHDLAWHEWVIDANRLIRNNSVDKAVRTGFGAETVQQFKTAIRDIATGEANDQDALSRVVAPIRKGAAVAGLGFNLMNAMIQPLGLTQSMVRIGPQWVGKGIAAWAKDPVKLVRTIYEKSEFMKNRGVTTTSRDLGEIRGVVQGKSAVRQKIDSLLFLPMVSMQLVADVPTWWGAYQKGLAQAPLDMDSEAVEARAVQLANQAVIDTQASGQVKDLAAIQRGGQTQRLFTVFYGYFSASYNLGVERAKATNYRSPLEIMQLAGDFLLLYTIPAVLVDLLYSAARGGDDDDPEELAKRLAGAQVSYLMGTMVGLREATTAVQKATGTNQFTFGYGGPAGLRFLQELDKLGQQIGQGDLDRALTRSAVNVGGVLLHLPSAQINRTIDGVIAVSEGDAGVSAVLFGPPPEKR